MRLLMFDELVITISSELKSQLWPVTGLAKNYIQNVTVSHVTLFLLNCSSFSKQL